MAFGKNPQVLGGVAPFGGSTQQRMHAASHRPRFSSRSTVPYWADGYTPTEHGSDLIRCIPGAYDIVRVDKEGRLYSEVINWWECVEHYHAVHKRGALCSAGPFRFDRKKREECYGCNIFWDEYSQRQAIAKEKGLKRVDNPKSLSMSDRFVVTVVDMGIFYKADRVDAQGRPQMNPNNNTPYYDWKKLRHQNDPAAYGKETKQGRAMPWAMGKDHWDTLNAYADKIGMSCLSCGQRNSLDWIIWQCGNPDCGMPLIRKSNTTYNMQELVEITRQPCLCNNCGVVAYMQEIVQCGHCPNGIRASIFDVDIEASRQKKSSGTGSQLIISNWSTPGPINPVYKELAKPLDLPARFAPDTLEKQSEQFKYQPAPPPNAPPQTYVQPYGAPGAPQGPPPAGPPAQPQTQGYTQPTGYQPQQQLPYPPQQPDPTQQQPVWPQPAPGYSGGYNPQGGQ